ncbi:MAG: hypothetical protein JEZ08_24210 [Clostridiales bacterium]|nr:hypothetical protein [Clostridiales bacterium]
MITSTTKIYDIINKENIHIGVLQLPKNRYGLYIEDEDGKFIFIDKSIEYDEVLLRIVLSEELGHHFKTVGDISPYHFLDSINLQTIEKEEEKALKWSSKFLVNTNSLLNFFKNNPYSSVQDVSDYFQVTDNFILLKLSFMAKELPQWYLKDQLVLNLLSLPDIYIGKILDQVKLNQVIEETSSTLISHTLPEII